MEKFVVVCQNCGIVSKKIMQCSKCKSVKYCSRECQKLDLKNHKTVCNAADVCSKGIIEKFNCWFEQNKNTHPWNKIPTPKGEMWCVEIKDINKIYNNEFSVCFCANKDEYCKFMRDQALGKTEQNSTNIVVESIEKAYSCKGHKVLIYIELHTDPTLRSQHIIMLL